MHCQNCGSQNDSGDKFCLKCGSRLEQSQSSQRQILKTPSQNLNQSIVSNNSSLPRTEERPWQGTTWAWMSFFAVLVSLVGIIGLMILMSNLGHLEVLADVEIVSDEDSKNFSLGMVILWTALVLVGAPLLIFYSFIMRGVLRGKKWSILSAFAFSILGALISGGLLFSLGGWINILSFIISGTLVALSGACLRHSYYN